MHPALIAYLLILVFVSFLAMRDDIVRGGKVLDSLLPLAALVLEVAMVFSFQFRSASATVVVLCLAPAAAVEIHGAKADLREAAAEPLPIEAVAVGLCVIIVRPAFVMGAMAYKNVT